MLTPYPGTPLYARLMKEGRIVDHDWSHYDNTHFRYLPVFEPKNMSRITLMNGCRIAERIAYSPPNTIRRLSATGMIRPSVWIANCVFMRRMLGQGSLLPREESADVSAAV